jgi:hypothetical protein
MIDSGGDVRLSAQMMMMIITPRLLPVGLRKLRFQMIDDRWNCNHWRCDKPYSHSHLRKPVSLMLHWSREAGDLWEDDKL